MLLLALLLLLLALLLLMGMVVVVLVRGLMAVVGGGDGGDGGALAGGMWGVVGGFGKHRRNKIFCLVFAALTASFQSPTRAAAHLCKQPPPEPSKCIAVAG